MSVASQTLMPDEVIVVDNNCKDETVAIAKEFPFVRIVHESKQGRGHARSAGFNAAKSDIIGRIDADSRLATDWVAHAVAKFSADNAVDGLTGIGKTSFIPAVQSVRTTLFSRCYYWFVHASFRTITMWGATMAVRRDAWLEVREIVCDDDTLVHEDQDVSLCIAATGRRIVQDNDLVISTSGQTYRYLPKILTYFNLFLSTKRRHKKNGNLNSPKLKKLSRIKTFPGFVFASTLAIFMLVLVTLFFPIDYIISRRFNNKEWLE